ncbi:MAG: hypothetical protein J6A90_08495 [Clostridia bacterium]|nr:hypothetical protein [Clostridia bacterium]
MKILGCFLILISSVSCAYFYEKSLKNKLYKYAEIIDFIKYAKNQIEYFSTPIDKIFASFEAKYISDIISSKAAPKLFGKDDEQLNTYFASLGKGYKKEQIDLSNYYISYFQDVYTKASYELPSKIKIFRAMSLFFGATTIIFLV